MEENIIMEEKFVGYKLAELAKKKGFNIIQRFSNEASLYNKEKEHAFYANYGFFGSGYNKGYISAPTQSFLQKWLRDIHKIHITVDYSNEHNKHHYVVYRNSNEYIHNITQELIDNDTFTYIDTYEECLEEALYKALSLIEIK